MMLDPLIAKLTTSSLSDTESYRRICASAAENDLLFRDFRCLPAYRRVSENVTREQGQAYLDEIRRNDPQLLEAPQWFKDNDKYGNPERYEYAGVGLVSPTTLRYVKVAAELRRLFGELRGCDIVEIGGGYGGQARILKALYPSVNYIIIDLFEACMLARMYLFQYRTDCTFVHDTEDVALAPYLVISNYALTECAPTVLTKYVDHIVQGSARGYVIGNAQEKQLFDLLASRHPERRDEVPLTGEGNFLCVWGERRTRP
jgi:hypothetical protein